MYYPFMVDCWVEIHVVVLKQQWLSKSICKSRFLSTAHLGLSDSNRESPNATTHISLPVMVSLFESRAKE